MLPPNKLSMSVVALPPSGGLSLTAPHLPRIGLPYLGPPPGFIRSLLLSLLHFPNNPVTGFFFLLIALLTMVLPPPLDWCFSLFIESLQGFASFGCRRTVSHSFPKNCTSNFRQIWKDYFFFFLALCPDLSFWMYFSFPLKRTFSKFFIWFSGLFQSQSPLVRELETSPQIPSNWSGFSSHRALGPWCIPCCRLYRNLPMM